MKFVKIIKECYNYTYTYKYVHMHFINVMEMQYCEFRVRTKDISSYIYIFDKIFLKVY